MKLLFVIFIAPMIFLTAGFMKVNDLDLRSLDDRPEKNSLKLPFNRELLKDATVSAQFKSNFDNLGIVGIRFETYYRINDDYLEFRLREQGTTDWYYTARYKTDQFQFRRIFPIGFPVIADSRGKDYYFELQSVSGTPGNAVAVSDEFPHIIGRHTFSKKQLLDDPILAIRFIIQKIDNLADYPGFTKTFLINSLPLAIILLFSLSGNSILLWFAFVAGVIYWDIFLNPDYYDYLLVSVIFAWYLVSRKHKLAGVVSGLTSLLLFGQAVFFTVLRNYHVVEKSTHWAIVFLAIALVVQTQELSRHEKPTSLMALWQRVVVEFDLLLGLVSRTSRQKTLAALRSPLLRKVLVAIIYFLPNVIIGWLLLNLEQGFRGSFLAYQRHLPANQTIEFFKETGLFLAMLYLFGIATLVLLSRKYGKKHLVIFIVLVLIFTSIFQATIIRAKDFSRPVVWSAKGWGLKEAWVDIFIDGRNFQDAPHVGKVLVDGVEQRVIRWSNSEIVFRTNPTTTKSGNLKVILEDGRESNNIDFLYLWENQKSK